MTLIGQTPSPADSAHRSSSASQGRIDAGVEEAFQCAVAHRLSAQLADALQPPGIAEKDKEDRRNPRSRACSGTARRSRTVWRDR